MNKFVELNIYVFGKDKLTKKRCTAEYHIKIIMVTTPKI